MKLIRSALKKTRLAKFIQDRGYLSKNERKQRFVNFIFQRILRVNSDCPFSVNFTSRVLIPSKISLGKNVDKSFLLNGHCYIQAINGISIGDGTIFGPGVVMVSANHDIMNIKESIKCRPIKIGSNCWIGANAVILPGIELGDNTIVGAGTVVNKSFPAGNVILINQRKLLVEKLHHSNISNTNTDS